MRWQVAGGRRRAAGGGRQAARRTHPVGQVQRPDPVGLEERLAQVAGDVVTRGRAHEAHHDGVGAAIPRPELDGPAHEAAEHAALRRAGDPAVRAQVHGAAPVAREPHLRELLTNK